MFYAATELFSFSWICKIVVVFKNFENIIAYISCFWISNLLNATQKNSSNYNRKTFFNVISFSFSVMLMVTIVIFAFYLNPTLFFSFHWKIRRRRYGVFSFLLFFSTISNRGISYRIQSEHLKYPNVKTFIITIEIFCWSIENIAIFRYGASNDQTVLLLL